MIEVTLQVSQGSAATHLSCGGNHDTGFIANFLQNLTVQELWKPVNITQSYEWITLCVFLTNNVYDIV